MSLYSSDLSDMTEKMISPIPNTVKLLMKVKRLRMLFNLSFIFIEVLVACGSRSERAPSSCG